MSGTADLGEERTKWAGSNVGGINFGREGFPAWSIM